MRGLNIAKYISGSSAIALTGYIASTGVDGNLFALPTVNCEKLERPQYSTEKSNIFLVIAGYNFKARNLLGQPKSINEYSDNGKVPDLLVFLEKVLKEVKSYNCNEGDIIGASLTEHPKLRQLLKDDGYLNYDDAYLNYLISMDAYYRELCRLTYRQGLIDGKIICPAKYHESEFHGQVIASGDPIYDEAAQADHAVIIDRIIAAVKKQFETDAHRVESAFPLLEKLPLDRFSDAENEKIKQLVKEMRDDISSNAYGSSIVCIIDEWLTKRFGEGIYDPSRSNSYHPILGLMLKDPKFKALVSKEYGLHLEAGFAFRHYEDPMGPIGEFDQKDADDRADNAEKIFKMVEAMLPEVKALEIPKDARIVGYYYNGQATFGFEKTPPSLMSRLYSSVGIFSSKTSEKAAEAAKEPYK